MVGKPYDYNYDIDGRTRKDWSSELDSSKLHQGQIWTSPQRTPQKTKFPYGLEKIEPKVCRDKRTGKIYHRKCTEDASGGSWYFEDELIFATPADKRNNNIWMDGYTGGLILMTKYEAREMGLTESEVLKEYRADELLHRQAKRYGNKVDAFFFNYRKDGSIESLYVPPPPPPPIIKYIEVPAPPPDKPIIEPEPVFVQEPEPVPHPMMTAMNDLTMALQSSKAEPVVERAEPVETDNTKMILLAIVGVGILIAIIFTLRGRQNG